VSQAPPAVLDGTVVQARALVRRYGQGTTAVDALRGVSMEVHRAALIAVMGPSGSGKSTLMFQFFNLLPMLSAEENVVLPLSIAGEKPDRAWLDELLSKTGLAERRTHRPSELSGGQQQRVAIARALVTRPTILFADEPTGNLDSKTGGEILDLLQASCREYGQTIVMVTHEPRAASIADRILFLSDGLIVKELTEATPGQVLEVMSKLQ